MSITWNELKELIDGIPAENRNELAKVRDDGTGELLEILRIEIQDEDEDGDTYMIEEG